MKVVDLHNDIFSHMGNNAKKGIDNTFKNFHFKNFLEGNVFLSIFNMWIEGDQEVENKFEHIRRHVSKELNNNKDIFKKILTKDDLINLDEKKINIIMSLEGIDYISEPDDIYYLFDYGIRSIALTWNYNNQMCHSQKLEPTKGLTKKGKEIIKIMEQLGMIIDVSHLSDKSIDDILLITSCPIIASHSNARRICNVGRNLKDEHIKEIKKRDGIIGINGYPRFISKKNEDKNIQGLIKHIKYIEKLAGENNIGLGFDFVDYLNIDKKSVSLDEKEIPNLKNHSHIKNLLYELRKEGFSEKTIEKIFYRNSMNVLKSIIK